MTKEKINLNLPINSVSFGSVSVLLLKTLFEKSKSDENFPYDLSLFPIGVIDLSAQKNDDEFNKWINSLIVKALESHSRKYKTFRLWHLQGSLESVSNNPTLLTFYELDKPTKIELNIARNNKTCFSSKYTCDIFKLFGIESTYLPLAFDSYNFSRIKKKFHHDDRIVFNLCGKFERRKHTEKVIKTWIKKYGGSRKYVLQCAIYNPFFNDQQNASLINSAVSGNKPFNVVFYPRMKENSIYNEFLNSANIILDMSGGESWSLPSFQSIAIGKHSVILNAHVFKDWATYKNSVLVNPSSQIDAADGIFFKSGDSFNIGNLFDFNEDDFIEGCEQAIARVESNPLNSEGLTLQTEYSKERFADSVVNLLKS